MTFRIPQDILDDLSSRFIINVPEEDRNDIVRICFQIELAHWFYVDYYCEANQLVSVSFVEFAMQIFENISYLKQCRSDLQQILANWKAYKKSVPTFGAILLSESATEVLLVQSFYHRASWSFPKGKINQNESPVECAIREVDEEIGFDISRLIRDDLFIEISKNEQSTRLYIIRNVNRQTRFSPKTRGEIRNIKWFKLKDLPWIRPNVSSSAIPAPISNKDKDHAFFLVMPFMRKLRRTLNGTTSPLPQAEHQQQQKPNVLAAHSWLNFKFDREPILRCLTAPV